MDKTLFLRFRKHKTTLIKCTYQCCIPMSMVEKWNMDVYTVFENALKSGDLYIAFTSTYEAMVHSAGMIDLECVGDSLLGTVMGHTPEEDILSLHVYRYSRADDRIEMLPISREG